MNSVVVPSASVADDADVAARLAGPRPRPRSVNASVPVIFSEAAVSPRLNCSGSTPMFTRLLRWIRSNDSAITALTPSSYVPLAAQSRDDPDPYSLPANTISGTPAA